MHARCSEETDIPIPPIPPDQNTLRKIFRDIVSSEFSIQKGARIPFEVKEKPKWWPDTLCFGMRGSLLTVKKGIGYNSAETLALMRGIFGYYRTRDRNIFDRYKLILLAYKPLSLLKACCKRHGRHQGYTIWAEDVVLGSTRVDIQVGALNISRVCMCVVCVLVHEAFGMCVP